MNNTKRTWLSILVAAVVLIVVIFTMPLYKIKPQVMYLPMVAAKPYNGLVEIYEPNSAPFAYQTLGVINLRYHIKNYTPKDESLVFNTLKKVAAKAGGNALLVIPYLTGPTAGDLSAMRVYMATAKVILTVSPFNPTP